MSRGPGRWQRLLLHAVYHATKEVEYGPPCGRVWSADHCRGLTRGGLLSGGRFVYPLDYVVTGAEYSAIMRAARALVKAGLVKSDITGCANLLSPLPEPPAVAANCPLCVSVQKIPTSLRSEHLEPSGVPVDSFSTPERRSAVSVQNADMLLRSEHLLSPSAQAEGVVQ